MESYSVHCGHLISII